MSKWKMVPVELTPAMVDAIDTGRTDSAGSIYYNLLAAAPKWEPSEAQIELALRACLLKQAEDGTIFRPTIASMRAAILAAVGGWE